MATYDSPLTGIQVDRAIEQVLSNNINIKYGTITGNISDNTKLNEALNSKLDSNGVMSKGNETTPVYVNANGIASPITSFSGIVDTTIADSDGNELVTTYATGEDYVNAEFKNVGVETATTLIKADRVWTNYDGILDDAEGKADVEAMKRSTFDRSKFIPVGSLTITNNGIASGFSGSNFLRTIIINENYNIKVKCRFKVDNVTNVYDTILGRSNSYNNLALVCNGNKLSLTSNGNNFTTITTTNDFSLGIYYDAIIDIAPSTISLKILNLDGTVFYENTAQMTTNYNLGFSFVLGTTASGQPLTNGSIDLKQFSITVDGVEVFNGNKTGIDQIKKDDYILTAVAPTITEDGIASGFGENKYIEIPQRLNMSNFEMQMSFTTPSVVQNDGGGLFVESTDTLCKSALRIGDSKKLKLFLSDNGTSWDIGQGEGTTVLQPNTTYDCKVIFDGATYKVFLATDNSSYKEEISIASAMPLRDLPIIIGRQGVLPFTGSIDLNKLKIFTNGNLVYQATLRIPYTLSKTGSKIVDAVYRDRVQDMHEQFGYANYYTKLSGEKYNVTKVGDVVLENGVASGFSNSNYLTLPIAFKPSTKAWTIKGKVRPLANSTHNDFFGASNATDFKHVGIGFSTDNKFAVFLSSNGTSWNIASNVHSSTIVNSDTDYYFRLVYNSTNYTLYTSTDKKNWVQEFVINNSTPIYQNDTPQAIGVNHVDSSRYYPFAGSIDLSEFLITVDGKEVFRAYEQDTYTLPQGGTLNGYNIVIDYTDNYKVDTDLNITQMGACTANQAVTFPKAFVDTSYTLSCPYVASSKTKTGFTPSQTGDYIAIGKTTLDEVYKQ